jgi:UrcA family protein
MSKPLIKLLAVAAALAFSGLGHANIRLDVPSVVVNYADLKLNKKADVVRLHARIRNAAQQVCTPLNSRVLGLREQYQSCVTDAIAQSVARINNPNLSNYHRYGNKASLVAAN